MTPTEEPAGDAPEKPEPMPISAIFAWELCVFITGMIAGFFWHLYYVESPRSQTHIIIGLCVIIICLWRYIMLFRRRYGRGEDS